MGIEIGGNGGRPPHEAVEAAKSQASSNNNPPARSASGNSAKGGDDVKLSNQVAQMKALEAQISKLPVVDTQRVQEVQHTLATGSFEIEPARVADKVLSFEAGLGKA